MDLCETMVIEIKRKNLFTLEGWHLFVNELKHDQGHNELTEAVGNFVGIDVDYYEKHCFKLFKDEIKRVFFYTIPQKI